MTLPPDLKRHDVDIAGKTITLWHRGTWSDVSVLKQTFAERQYDFPRPDVVREEYRRIGESGKAPLIIDAGANIGTSVAMFAETFPGSHIVAIEPEADNIELLVRNCRDYWVDFRLAALSDKAGTGHLVNPRRGEWAYRVVPEGDGAPVSFMACDSLVAEKLAAGFEPFLFKMDIEGGEIQLFASASEWLDLFPFFVGESHDWLMPGMASSRNMLRALTRTSHDLLFKGENIFAFRVAG
jgi:FkbM family methyltransferase